ncbi:MAG: polymerase sigma factor SigW [Planctomycetota bacterium]|jgi:RNA polymerase sigma-70 factor (ECF subfamily)
MNSFPSNSDPVEDEGARLMLAWKAGDEAAFDRIVELYSDRLWALLTRFLGPRPQREDLVQEVFLRLVKSKDRYEPTARFSTYLFRIAFNLAVNTGAKASERRTERLAQGENQTDPLTHMADAAAQEPFLDLERADTVRAVRAAIAALPEQQRMALVLAKYHDLPYDQIGEVLGTSEKAVKSLVHRARENLRAALAPYMAKEVRGS